MKTKTKTIKPVAKYRIPIQLSDPARSAISAYRVFMLDKYHTTLSINSAVNTLIEFGWQRVAQANGEVSNE